MRLVRGEGQRKENESSERYYFIEQDLDAYGWGWFASSRKSDGTGYTRHEFCFTKWGARRAARKARSRENYKPTIIVVPVEE